MVVTSDLGDLRNIHPPRKKEVGERLALWALSKDYARNDVEYSGPQYRQGSIEIRGSKAVLHFEHVGKGLVSSDGQALTSFLVAGSDDVFFPAQAEIAGDAILITSPQVAEPRVVRFAWDETAAPNLFNRDGLPAAPFRTDNPFKKSRQDLPQPR
jgi:sialate O-acetylesterase